MATPTDAGPTGGDSPETGAGRGSATRRGLLTTLLATLFAGALGTRYVVGTSRAHAAVDSLSVSGDSVTTDDGQLTGLTATVTGHVSYDGLDGQAATVETALYAAPAGGAVDSSANRIADTSADVGATTGLGTHAGHLDFDFTDADVLAAGDLSKSDFAATGDGTTKDTDVDFGLVLTVSDAGGTALASTMATATATISVTNQTRQSGASGSGSTNASGTNQGP